MLKYLNRILILVLFFECNIFFCYGIIEAQKTERFDGPGFIVFTFAEALKNSKTIDESLKLIGEATTRYEPPYIGGMEFYTYPPMANYLFNSAPQGNCGALNTIGASIISTKFGYPFRYAGSTAHVITEIQIAKKWYVVDAYTGDALTNERLIPLYSLDEMTYENDDEKQDKIIWNRTRSKKYASLFKKCVSPAKQIFYYPNWIFPKLYLSQKSFIIVQRKFHNIDLIREGYKYINAELCGWEGRNLSVMSLHMPLGEVRNLRYLNVPFFIYNVSIYKTDKAVPILGFRKPNSFRIYPLPPKGINKLNKIGYWKKSSENVSNIGGGYYLENSGIYFVSDYINKSGVTQYFWMPIIYQTDTPAAPSDPVGNIITNTGFTNIYANSKKTHFSNLFFRVPKGEKIKARINVLPKHSLRIISLDSNYGIESLINPQMPSMGIEIDASGIDAKWDNKINCKIDMLINPAFAKSIQFYKR